MSIPIAIPAIGTLLQVGNGQSPEIFNSIANIGDLTGPGVAGAVVDVTSHTSTSAPWRQKIVTLLDPGTITLPLYFVPASGAPTGAGTFMGHSYTTGGVGSLFARRGLSPGVPFNWKIIYPDGNNSTDEFQAFLSKYSQKAPVAGVLTADLELTLTGIPSFC